jgi:hypothetical protein
MYIFKSMFALALEYIKSTIIFNVCIIKIILDRCNHIGEIGSRAIS